MGTARRVGSGTGLALAATWADGSPGATPGTGDAVDSAGPVATATKVDGRSARRQRGRDAVIDVVVDLLDEGRIPPPTGEVTARAGISEATLYRYFDTIDDLQLLATRRFLDRHLHLFAIPPGGDDLPSRIDRFTAARGRLWEQIAPVARLGRARSFDHPAMDDMLRAARQAQADQTARHFGPELQDLTPAARDDLVAVVVTTTSFEAWELQHRDLGRTPAQIKRAWRSGLQALLGSAR